MMDPILKQRLVGATVLSALAVIFVPMIFDDSGSSSNTRDFYIPEVPKQLEPERLESLEDVGKLEPPTQPVPDPDPVEDKLSRRDEGNDQNDPLTAWVIQVGSFSKTENAEQLRDQLRKAGYPAYVETGKQDGAVLYRVRIGPELDPARASSQRDEIAQKFNVKGIVLPVH
jgi:DedD protein